MMNRGSLGSLAALAAALGFAACGGSSVKHVSDDELSGRGGTTARGGTGGGSGASAGGSHSAGGAGGSMPGGGGASARGGGGGTQAGRGGTAGTTGGSGAGNGTCTCTTDGRDIDCRSDTVTIPQELRNLEECTLSDATIVKFECEDGSVSYDVEQGGEYYYEIERGVDGKATFFHASGYANVAQDCGIELNELELGTLTQGQRASGSCTPGCSLCEPVEGYIPCGACNVDAATGTAHPALDEYCIAAGCPATFTEAREQRALNCNLGHSVIVSGCGLDIMEQEVGESGIAYYFDNATGKLLGVVAYDDTPFGPCHATSYRVGTVPDAPCASASTCDFCKPAGDGDAGAAGAGSAGEGAGCAP